MPRTSNLGQEELILAHSLRTQSTVGGKAWWQEDEAAAGHSASSVRMERER